MTSSRIVKKSDIRRIEKLANKINEDSSITINKRLKIAEKVYSLIEEIANGYPEEKKQDVRDFFRNLLREKYSKEFDKTEESQAQSNIVDIKSSPKPKEVSLPKLEDRIEDLLKEEGLPEGERAELRHKFMAQVNRAKEAVNKPKLELPEEPPELWKSGQGETALEFLQRVYKDYLKAEVLTWKWLKVHDPKLVKTLSSTLSQKKNLPKSILLPLTESQVIDKAHQELILSIGQEYIDKAYQVKSALVTRERRSKTNPKNLSDNLSF